MADRDGEAGAEKNEWLEEAARLRARIDTLSKQLSEAAQAAAQSAEKAADAAELLAPVKQDRSASNEGFFSFGGPLVVLLYLASTALLAYGTAAAKIWPLLLMIAIFSLWDVMWLSKGPGMRTAQEMLNSSTRARTYMSYFLAAYGAGLAFFLFRFSDDQQMIFFELLDLTGLPAWVPVVPLGLFGIALLFIPIQLGKGTGELEKLSPSIANRAVLAITAWVQKIGTYIFLYSVISILLRVGAVPPAQDVSVCNATPPVVEVTCGPVPSDGGNQPSYPGRVKIDAELEEGASLLDDKGLGSE